MEEGLPAGPHQIVGQLQVVLQGVDNPPAAGVLVFFGWGGRESQRSALESEECGGSGVQLAGKTHDAEVVEGLLEVRDVGLLLLLQHLPLDEVEEELELLRDRQHQRAERGNICLLYTSPSPRDLSTSRMPSSA